MITRLDWAYQVHVGAAVQQRTGSDRAQPWRCLWRGSVQMTMTRPCRRITRHLLQIRLTLGLTFTVCLTSGDGRPGYLYR
jgi:hypothetical protein